ncbi:MAG: ATP-binding protein [Bacteroidales bacterium]|nr:ATP-binding protein [Bacteroidales bacterium]
MKIAIASGKGGTGKTTISTNLALSMASDHRVLLADMDVEEPDSALFIKGNHLEERIVTRDIPVWDSDRCTLCGECQEICNFNAVVRIASQIMIFPNLCHSCYACSELCRDEALPMKPSRIGVITRSEQGNLTFVEGRIDIGQEQAVPLIKSVGEYIESIADKDTVVIMDSPPGSSCPVMEVVGQSDFVILVTEPTPFGLNDLQIAVETVRKLGKPFGVIINRSTLGNSAVADYCRAERIRVIASIPNSLNIARIYSAGGLSCGMDPDMSREIGKVKAFIKLIS